MQSTSHRPLLALLSQKVADGYSIAEGKKALIEEVAALAGVDAVAMKASAPLTSAPQPALTLSERTREIMNEKQLSFAAAQRLASVEHRSMFLRKGR